MPLPLFKLPSIVYSSGSPHIHVVIGPTLLSFPRRLAQAC